MNIGPRIMFWSVDTDHLYYVDELLEKADGYAERAIGRNMLPEDRVLLDEAFKHMQVFSVGFLSPIQLIARS